MKKEWHIRKADHKLTEKITRIFGCHPATAAVLVNRDLSSARDIKNFINPSLSELKPPFSIKDIDKAAIRIGEAVKNREKILVFGDYDVDGITSTTLLVEFLQYSGADADFHIPHRTKEGYSIQPDHIASVAVPKGVNLIITVDCGSSSHDAASAAARAGIDMIITDHHAVSPPYPDAVAFVNPQRDDCPSGLKHLAGVGVAFYLLIAMRKHFRENGFWENRPEPNLKSACDIVALGTVADMVPLRDENRILVKSGLDIINNSPRTGIQALINESGLKNGSVSEEDIAFRLSPRLNAAGRMDHAVRGVDLLTSGSLESAQQQAEVLNILNSERQKTEKEILEEILGKFERNPNLLQKNAIVLASSSWHIGVLGIVASKLVEKFFKPVVLISIENGVGKGSARSIPGLNLYRAFSECASHLENFGGHEAAGGLRINVENVPDFSKKFEDAVKMLTMPEMFVPKIQIDCHLNLDDISENLVEELERLQPWGIQNPAPLFLARNVAVLSSTIVGKSHRRMILAQSNSVAGKKFTAMHFNINPSEEGPAFLDQFVFSVRRNIWNGRESIQLVVADM